MAEITAALVKELREVSGAGMMDCKRALGETGGDIEAAIDWLRKKGLAAAAKKSGRIAAEGLVCVVAEGNMGALVEVNAETDFVGRNDQFQDFVRSAAKAALANDGDITKVAAAPYPGGSASVAETLTNMIAKIGENMNLRRSTMISVPQGIVASYMHNSVVPGLGKIGVLVALESSGDTIRLAELGKQIAMHVAAANPLFLDISSVDPTALDREREILKEQARASGKPENIIDKMVEGRVRKYYEDVVLLEQVYVIDGETRVNKVVENAAKAMGAPVKLAGFVRYALGEGIAKEEKDFAAEVAAQLK
jgi:elongation factor Ts